jgi:hypothetical protein
VLAHAIVGTTKSEDCSNWKEVNEMKLLFRAGQPWTTQAAHEFCIAAWLTLGLGS